MAEQLITEVYQRLIGALGRPAGISSNVLCPFHADTTPSMKLDVEKNVARCFSCRRSWTPDQFEKAILGQDEKFVLEGGVACRLVDQFEREILNLIKDKGRRFELRKVFEALDFAREKQGLSFVEMAKLWTIVKRVSDA